MFNSSSAVLLHASMQWSTSSPQESISKRHMGKTISGNEKNARGQAISIVFASIDVDVVDFGTFGTEN